MVTVSHKQEDPSVGYSNALAIQYQIVWISKVSFQYSTLDLQWVFKTERFQFLEGQICLVYGPDHFKTKLG